MILAGDVGGTKTNLGFFTYNNKKLHTCVEKQFNNNDYSSFTDLLKTFVEENRYEFHSACFGIAGPIRNQCCTMTNLPWTVDANCINKLFNVETFLINDLEANAYGIQTLSPQNVFSLYQGKTNYGNIAIISAGTGLGEAGIYYDGNKYHPFATEGGHTDFAPQSEMEIKLLQYLLIKYPHVSYEHVLSGNGIINIYTFFRDIIKQYQANFSIEKVDPTNTAKLICEAAVEKKCPLCVQTLELFSSIFGSESGNLALKMMATGGVYIGGGIAPNIIPFLKNGTFVKAFMSKGRMSCILKDFPINIITYDKTAMHGAAIYAAIKQ